MWENAQEGKETGTQIKGLDQKEERNIQPEQNEERRIQKHQRRGLGISEGPPKVGPKEAHTKAHHNYITQD